MIQNGHPAPEREPNCRHSFWPGQLIELINSVLPRYVTRRFVIFSLLAFAALFMIIAICGPWLGMGHDEQFWFYRHFGLARRTFAYGAVLFCGAGLFLLIWDAVNRFIQSVVRFVRQDVRPALIAIGCGVGRVDVDYFLFPILMATAVYLLLFWHPSVSVRAMPQAPIVDARTAYSASSIEPQMVPVPRGVFVMGSKEEIFELQHTVEIDYDFEVSKYPITFTEWDACVTDGGCDGYSPPDQDWGRGRQPVINVSWIDAKSYIEWINRKTGKNYRLLSEAEFEYVSRAGTTTIYWWGNGFRGGHAACTECGSPWDGAAGRLNRPPPVGSFPPNNYGLHDTIGSVHQWVEDCFYQYDAVLLRDGSPFTAVGCERHGLRGGAFNYLPWDIRVSARNFAAPAFRGHNIGFRIARTLSPR